MDNKIREFLKYRNMTQEDLSRITGIAQPTLSRIINGKKEIYLESAFIIAKALNCKIEDVFIWTG
jgi:DNA-binding XRE family transcriptional regulator